MEKTNVKSGMTSFQKFAASIGRDVDDFTIDESVRAKERVRPSSSSPSSSPAPSARPVPGEGNDFQWTVRVPGRYKDILRRLKYGNPELSYRDIAVEALDYLEKKYNL